MAFLCFRWFCCGVVMVVKRDNASNNAIAHRSKSHCVQSTKGKQVRATEWNETETSKMTAWVAKHFVVSQDVVLGPYRKDRSSRFWQFAWHIDPRTCHKKPVQAEDRMSQATKRTTRGRPWPMKASRRRHWVEERTRKPRWKAPTLWQETNCVPFDW